MAFAPTVTVRLDMNPVPRAEIVFTAVPVGTATATVYRYVNGARSVVRGLVGVSAAGGFAGVDTEIPFLVDVSYRAEAFGADGLSLGLTDETVVFADFDGTVFHQPLYPSVAAVVDPLPSFASAIDRVIDAQEVRPGRNRASVTVSFGGGGVTSTPLDVATDSLEAARAVREVLSGDPLMVRSHIPVVCVRTSPKWHLPSPFYASVLRVSEQRFNTQFDGEIIYWLMEGRETRPPAEALAVGVLTYADMELSYATYDDISAAYSTYLDAESDFTLAGVS